MRGSLLPFRNRGKPTTLSQTAATRTGTCFRDIRRRGQTKSLARLAVFESSGGCYLCDGNHLQLPAFVQCSRGRSHLRFPCGNNRNFSPRTPNRCAPFPLSSGTRRHSQGRLSFCRHRISAPASPFCFASKGIRRHGLMGSDCCRQMLIAPHSHFALDYCYSATADDV